MDRKSIIIIDNSQYVTGALNSILDSSEYARAFFTFTYLLPTGSRAIPTVRERGFEVEEISFVEISRSPKNLLLYLPYLLINSFRLKRLARKHQASLVHVNDFYNLTGACARLLGGNFKLVTHVRFMPDRFPHLLVRLWLKLNLWQAQHLITVSDAVKNCLPHHPKIHTIYNGLDEKYPALPDRNGSHEVHLLYLAHYIPGKGHELALDAFYLAWQQNQNLRLKMVGGDHGLEKNRKYKKMLMEKARALKISHVVEFRGATSQAKNEYLHADIFLNFSESESFSITCLDALAFGIPLIASDCGGPSELFEHMESGWLVPNGDVAAMADAILRLSQDEALRRKFNQKSVEYVKEKFAPEKTWEVLLRLYRDLAGL